MIEAKWSALYHHSDIVAYYEPQSFKLVDDAGNQVYKQYTPDFYLVDQDMYHEVKLCIHPTRDEFKKCYYLAKTIKRPIIITWSDMSTNPKSVMFYPDGTMSGKVKFVKCPMCKECGWFESGLELKCNHNIDTPSNLLSGFIKKVITSDFIKS